MKTLYDAKVLETVFVVGIFGEENIKYRIMELGITNGVKVIIKRFAPIGGPVEVFVRGYSLCIGKNEAKNILIV